MFDNFPANDDNNLLNYLNYKQIPHNTAVCMFSSWGIPPANRVKFTSKSILEMQNLESDDCRVRAHDLCEILTTATVSLLMVQCAQKVASFPYA
jgi:hypothetical protein